MATYTAADQINRALRLLGVLAEGEVPSANTSNDALVAFNQMVDSWSIERLSVFATMDQVFTWPSGDISRTLGPSGDFTGLRPIALDDATYFTVNNLSYDIGIINQEQYDSIVLKTVSSPYPELLFVNMDYPNITMFLYPVPSTDLEFHFISVTPLDQPASLATVLSFPPGYLEAFAYNLACTLSSEFGIDPPKRVQQIAIFSKRAIKRQNNPYDVMSMPNALVGGYGTNFNIFTGQP